jgi:hypothetical protein
MTEEAKRCVECLLEAAIFQRCEDCYIGNMCECEDSSECQLVQYANLVKDISAELERVKKERDAAVKDLRTFTEPCRACAHVGSEDICRECRFELIEGHHITRTGWEWRGVKEEE